MSENEIRVLYVQPGKYPEERTIPNTLRALQELVGGDIECCRPWRDSVCVICNDSGKIDGLPPNRLYGHTDFLAGSFVVCGNGGEDFISLTDRQVFLYERLYHNPVVFLPTPHGLLPMKCTPEQYEQFQRDGNKLKIKPIDHGERCQCDNRQRGVKSAYPLSYRCHHYRQIVGKEQRNENESYRLSYAKTRILLCRSESAHR